MGRLAKDEVPRTPGLRLSGGHPCRGRQHIPTRREPHRHGEPGRIHARAGRALRITTKSRPVRPVESRPGRSVGALRSSAPAVCAPVGLAASPPLRRPPDLTTRAPAVPRAPPCRPRRRGLRRAGGRRRDQPAPAGPPVAPAQTPTRTLRPPPRPNRAQGPSVRPPGRGGRATARRLACANGMPAGRRHPVPHTRLSSLS